MSTEGLLNKKSYNSIDLMKFIMALVVVSIHTEPFWTINCLPALHIVESIRQISVPFFFIACGFLLAMKEKQGKTDVLKKHARKSFVLYTVLSVVYLPLAIYYYLSTDRSFVYNLIHYVRGFFVTGEHYNSWMLWYLIAVAYCLLLIQLLDKLGLKRKNSLVILIVIGVAAMATINPIVTYNGEFTGALARIYSIIANTIVDDRLFRALVYIPIGMFFAEVKDKRKIAIISAIVLLVSYPLIHCGFIQGFGIQTPLLMTRSFWNILASTGFFGLVLCTDLKDGPIYSYLRSISSFMYFSHLWVWTIYYMLVYGEKMYGFSYYVATVVICVLLGTIIYFVRKRRGK